MIHFQANKNVKKIMKIKKKQFLKQRKLVIKNVQYQLNLKIKLLKIFLKNVLIGQTNFNPM